MFVRNQTTAAAVIAHRIRNRSAPTSKMSAMSRKLTPARQARFGAAKRPWKRAPCTPPERLSMLGAKRRQLLGGRQQTRWQLSAAGRHLTNGP
jgi:hypothetical protein